MFDSVCIVLEEKHSADVFQNLETTAVKRIMESKLFEKL